MAKSGPLGFRFHKRCATEKILSESETPNHSHFEVELAHVVSMAGHKARDREDTFWR